MTNTDIALDPRLLERLEKKKKLLDHRRPLPVDALRRLQEELRLAHTYNSNAIEGNTLSMQETKVILEEGITIGGKSIREHLETTGNANGFDLIMELAKRPGDLDHVVIQRLHEVVTAGQIEQRGRYRTTNVRIAGAKKSPPDFSKVPRMMEAFLKNIREMEMHPVLKAAFVHHAFVEIHPFVDGNGRVARLITNLYLMWQGYPPVVLRKEDRRRYYRCLAQADEGNLCPLAEFIGAALDGSLTLYLSVFGGHDELRPLAALARGTSYSQEYLSLRARQGVLSAVKMGRTWHSTQRDLEAYLRTIRK
jgi:Fic family protein